MAKFALLQILDECFALLLVFLEERTTVKEAIDSKK